MCAIPQRGMVTLPPAYRASAPRVPVPRLRRFPPRPPPPEELLPLLLRLFVLLPHARLQFSRPLAESPQDVLRSPEFLLVLQPVLLQELVLRLDALRLPRMGRPLELRSRELRVAQRSHLGRFLRLCLLFFLLLFLLAAFLGLLCLGGLQGGLLRDAARQARSTGCAARGPSGPSHAGRPCTIGSSSCG